MHIVPGDPLEKVSFVDDRHALVDGVLVRRVGGGAGILALQSNPQPDAGMTATQSVPPPITPADIEALVEQSLNLGDSKGIRIASVGLGVRVITHWNVVYSFINAAAGAVTINVSNVWPFNHPRQTLIQINGGAQVYAADGLATLAVMTRNKPGTWEPTTGGGFGLALQKALVKVTLGANISGAVNATGAGNFSGITSFVVALTSTGVVTVDFWTVEKLCLDRQSLLGMLPLQNNSTFALMTRQVVNNAIGAGPNNHAFPFFTAGAVPGTLTHTAVATVTSTYDFWSVPSDPGLYQEMVQNSYQVQQQQSVGVAVTGPAALTYNIPQNQFMVAAHLWGFDT